MPILAFKASVPGAKMLRRRQARPLGNDAYEVIGRDGKRRYRVFVLKTGETICTCLAGRDDKPCWHAVRALKRHLALEANRGS